MPTVHSKTNFDKKSTQINNDINQGILNQLNVPSKCLSCAKSCDVCMVTCGCERCVLRRRLEPNSVDRARIAMLQTQRKFAYMEKRKKKKVVYEHLKSCIVKVTKRGSYKKQFHIGEGADRLLCCKDAFDKTFHINHTYVDDLVCYMKKKVSQ